MRFNYYYWVKLNCLKPTLGTVATTGTDQARYFLEIFYDVMSLVNNTKSFQVRAFAGWPGTRAKIQVANSKNNGFDLLDIKVISTRACHEDIKASDKDEILFSRDALQIPCAGNSWLEVSS